MILQRFSRCCPAVMLTLSCLKQFESKPGCKTNCISCSCCNKCITIMWPSCLRCLDLSGEHLEYMIPCMLSKRTFCPPISCGCSGKFVLLFASTTNDILACFSIHAACRWCNVDFWNSQPQPVGVHPAQHQDTLFCTNVNVNL